MKATKYIVIVVIGTVLTTGSITAQAQSQSQGWAQLITGITNQVENHYRREEQQNYNTMLIQQQLNQQRIQTITPSFNCRSYGYQGSTYTNCN